MAITRQYALLSYFMMFIPFSFIKHMFLILQITYGISFSVTEELTADSGGGLCFHCIRISLSFVTMDAIHFIFALNCLCGSCDRGPESHCIFCTGNLLFHLHVLVLGLNPLRLSLMLVFLDDYIPRRGDMAFGMLFLAR